MLRKILDSVMVNWTLKMLATYITFCNCPHLVVLLPLLWTLDIYDQFQQLNDLGLRTKGCAKTLVICVTCWDDKTTSNRMYQTFICSFKWGQ